MKNDNIIRVLFILGADQKFGANIAAITLMDSINDNIEFTVLTQKYGKVNEYCNCNGIRNYVVHHKYCEYRPYTNKFLDLIKKSLRKIETKTKNIIAFRRSIKTLDINSFDIIDTNINRDELGLMLSRKYRKPHVVHLREFLDLHFNLKFLYRNHIKDLNQYTDIFLAVSSKVKEHWIEKGIDRNKITVVYDGVNSKKFSIKNTTIHSPIQIVMVGAIYPEKGQIQLIEAISLLTDNYRTKIHVDIYGEGKTGYVDLLRTQIKNNKLENTVCLKGYKNNMHEILSDYDIGFMGSKGEGFGLVTIEYMMAGLCVIASDTGANLELLKDHETGFLYSYNNIEEIKNILIDIIDNPNIIDDIGGKSRENAIMRFDAKICAEQTYDVYKKLLEVKK